MVILDEYEKLLQSLWSNDCKNPKMEPRTWLPFLSFLLNSRTLNNFPNSTDNSNNEFITLSKLNNLVIYYTKNDCTARSIVKACIKSGKSHFSKLTNVLVLNPSITGVNFFYFSSQSIESSDLIKIIHLPQGQMPNYFQDIIRTKSVQNFSPIELLQEIFDVSKLETNFIFSIKEKLQSISDLRIQMIAYLTLLLTCSQFLLTKDFQGWLKSLSTFKHITFQHFLKEFSTQQGIKNDLISKLEGIIKELGLSSIPIDIHMFQEFLRRYPYSLKERGVFIQEIAITPSVLSELTESLPTSSSKKKKEGKYYTSTANAEFISCLAVYRLLSNKILNIKSDVLLNWVYPDWGLIEKQSKITLDQLSKISGLRVLDPACGTGTFILSLSRLFCHFTDLRSFKDLKNSQTIELIGIDPDEIAVLITRIRLIFFKMNELSRISVVSFEKKENFPIKWNIIKGDFFKRTEIHKKNFDLILGNPPWVRHEDIGINQIPRYKDYIQTQIQNLSPNNIHFDRKSDLYIYFCLLGLSLLKHNGGILAFLTSNAWLEVKYGQTLQRFLLDPKNQIFNFDIIHRRGKRLWNRLGINSIILIAERSSNDPAKTINGTFTETKVNFLQIPLSSLQKGLIARNEYEDQFYRTEQIPRDLLKKTHKWAGTFLRMSYSERKLIQHIRNAGVPLVNLAEVRFGIKTGANDFFHLECYDKKRSDGKVKVRNRIGYEGLIEEKYLAPLIKSPSHVKGFIIPHSFSPRLWLFYCFDSPSQIQGSGAWAYIKWGENSKVKIKQGKKSGNNILGFSSVHSVKQRNNWYSICNYPIPSLLWTKSYHDKLGCFFNQAEMLPDQRFYGIIVKQKEYLPLIFTFLNSSLVWAQIEAQGNTNMGFGVLDTNVYWLRKLKIPVEAMAEVNQIETLMGKLINEKNRVSMLEYSKTRNEIDHFYAKHLNLSDKAMKRLYGFILRSIKNRLQ